MLKHTIAAIAVTALSASSVSIAEESESVTPQDVIAKVREAAAYLAKTGGPGLAIFERRDSPFIWKDTYVFVYNCAADVIAAHPVATSRGVKISSLKGADGKAYGTSLCEAAKKPGGGWIEYVWPKPVEDINGQVVYSDQAFRKVSYIDAVDGQPYEVGAGIYNDVMTIDQLNALARK
jgi:hypothetical protein